MQNLIFPSFLMFSCWYSFFLGILPVIKRIFILTGSSARKLRKNRRFHHCSVSQTAFRWKVQKIVYVQWLRIPHCTDPR
jgi:hypothetical protein